MQTTKIEENVLQKCNALFEGSDEMLQTINVRRSNRTFEDVPLKKEHIDLINEYLSTKELLTGPFGKSFRIEFIDRGPMKKNAHIGTYGYVKDPRGYLVGMSENDMYTLFELAYVFHGLVLFLTNIGIGTCWLGGIFNQKDVRSSTYIAPDEIVPAISPIGYTKDSLHLFGRLAQGVLKSRTRRPVEEIAFLGNFDVSFTDQQSLLYNAIHFGTLAPNAQNKQSWRIVVSKNQSCVHFYVKFHLKKQVHDGFRGYACPPEYLDIGIFYRQFEIAMNNHEIKGTLEVNDPGLNLPEEDMEYIITWKMKDE